MEHKTKMMGNQLSLIQEHLLYVILGAMDEDGFYESVTGNTMILMRDMEKNIIYIFDDDTEEMWGWFEGTVMDVSIKDITELKTIIPKNLGGYSTDLSRIPVDFIYYRSTPEKEDWMCRLRYLNNRTFTNHGCDSQYIKSFEPEFDERLDKYLEGEEGRERSIVERYMRLLRINRSMNIIRKRKKTFILDGNDFFDMDDFEGD